MTSETVQPVTNMADKPFAKLSGDDRRWRVESAARTLQDYAKVLRDKPLLRAARNELKKQIADSQKALKTT